MTKRSIKALLFSDVKGFSKMTDRECLVFCQNFYSGIQRDVFSKYDSDSKLQFDFLMILCFKKQSEAQFRLRLFFSILRD